MFRSLKILYFTLFTNITFFRGQIQKFPLNCDACHGDQGKSSQNPVDWTEEGCSRSPAV